MRTGRLRILPRPSVARALAAFAALAITGVAEDASAARCPDAEPDDPACEVLTSVMMPSVAAVAYFPRGGLHPYVGPGVEFAALSWSSNNDAFGPSQGAVRFGVAYMPSSEEKRAILLYRLGWVVSFEGNASRRFLIPYWGGGIGALWETELGTRALAEASLGTYIFYGRGFTLDAAATAVLPFTAVDTLLAPKVQLTASFSLW
jgi:hypothetical protein